MSKQPLGTVLNAEKLWLLSAICSNRHGETNYWRNASVANITRTHLTGPEADPAADVDLWPCEPRSQTVYVTWSKRSTPVCFQLLFYFGSVSQNGSSITHQVQILLSVSDWVRLQINGSFHILQSVFPRTLCHVEVVDLYFFLLILFVWSEIWVKLPPPTTFFTSD